MDQRMVLARRSVSEALRLDSEQFWKEAYQQYLSCVMFMFQILLDESRQKAVFSDLQTSETAKVLRVARQCMDRVTSLISETTTPGNLPPVPAAGVAAATCTSSEMSQSAPSGKTMQQPDNASTYQDVHRSASVSTHASQRTPEVQRSRAMTTVDTHPGSAVDYRALSSVSQSVPPQCSDQTASSAPLQRHASAGTPLSGAAPVSGAPTSSQPSKLSPVELANQRNKQLMMTYQARLKRLNASGMSEASKSRMNMSILRQLQENIAIAKRQQAALTQKMNERQHRIAEEHRKRLEEAQDPLDHRQLSLDVEEFEKNLGWVKEHRKKITSQADDDNCITTFVNAILSSKEHPIARKLGLFQYQIYHKLLPLVKQGRPLASVTPVPGPAAIQTPFQDCVQPAPSATVAASSSDELNYTHHRQRPPMLSRSPTEPSQDEDDDTLSTVLDILGMGMSSNLATDASEAASGSSRSNTPTTSGESVVCQTDDKLPSSTPAITPQSILDYGKGLCSEEELEQAENYACMLKEINKDVHNAIDLLEVALLVVYKEVRTSTGRDQCRVAIETNLFPALWPLLLDVLRVANTPREKAYASSLSSNYHKSLGDLGVSAKYQLVHPDQHSPPAAQPYEKAICELRRMSTLPVPLEKLECVVAVSRIIIQTIEEHYVSIGQSRQQAALGCDDLLPILGYCLVRAGTPQLISECAAMEEFIHEGYLMGEEGYCLTTLQTAVSHVASLAMSQNTS